MKRTAFLCIVAALAACSPSADPERVLSSELLMRGGSVELPAPLSEFAPPDDAAPASNTFAGRLVLDTGDQDNLFVLWLDELGIVTPGSVDIIDLPAFDFAFVQDGEFLVPVTTGPVRNDHGWWEYVFTTGRVWDEVGDNGWSRAALPFALKERREDCIHNGLMTFLFRDSGEVSGVVFQVVSQTCRYLQFQVSGLLAASYVAEDVAGAADVIARERRSRSGRLPVRPIASVSADYIGANSAAFGSREEIAESDMTAFGFIIDGMHYVGGCNTPFGNYPYCDELALPSYSTAKSLVGGFGLMLLEQAYPGAAATPVAELIPECSDGWDDVTVEHALDMTTGYFGSPEMHGDEDAAISGKFFASEHAGRIDVACHEFPRKAEPGTHLSYHTWDTYLAGAAMNSWLRKNRGPDADFFDDLLVPEIWEPLGLSRISAQTRRTYDDIRQPYTGYGLTLLRDDVAKFAQFIGVMDGRIGGGDLLDRELFDAIWQRNPDDRGLVAELEAIRYNNGFRSFDVSSYIGCDAPVWVVVLSGFGGIIVAVMPNDTAYYYFSDGDEYRYLSAVRESHRIRQMCDG